MRNGKVAVVTGAASGIGSAVAKRFVAEGFEVWAMDLKEPADSSLSFVSADLSDRESLNEAVTKLPKHIDVLVNAAGVSGLLPIPTVMNVNFYGLRALTGILSQRITPGGAVVNIASTSGWFWRDHIDELQDIIGAHSESEISEAIKSHVADGYTAYARSKEAVVVWSAMAAQEFLGRFRVNSVSPGPVQTPLLDDFYEAMGHEELDPLTARAGGRNGLPEEIADVIFFLASDSSRWINGTDVPVDNSAEVSEFLAAKGFIERLVKQ
jgi:NAD(P)-dependent dehydrogenase (short-subunit alcohol dehydrogenase family)